MKDDKTDQIFSEGEDELLKEKEKITMKDLLRKSAVVILKSLKFKTVKKRTKR